MIQRTNQCKDCGATFKLEDSESKFNTLRCPEHRMEHWNKSELEKAFEACEGEHFIVIEPEE